MRKLALVLAAVAAYCIPSPASATLIVNFTFDGTQYPMGTVSGYLTFDNTGVGVAATGAYVTASSIGILGAPGLNYATSASRENSFDVAADGTIGNFRFFGSLGVNGRADYLGLNGLGTYNLYEEDIGDDGIAGVILNYDGQRGVRFTSTSASPSPEPSSWEMMLIGFGAVGAGLRRRMRMAELAAPDL